AQLAGVPPAVIKAARKHLARLESQALDATPQRDLFAQVCEEPALEEADAPVPDAPAASSELLDALADIDPDALTPREALARLYELKRLAA
ncbi:MAG TPA: DNA mismatch repair protein MutS, partial [Massilia sp.]|nr:DNA mismatch repair protein MutS [Massilia sp.]